MFCIPDIYVIHCINFLFLLGASCDGLYPASIQPSVANKYCCSLQMSCRIISVVNCYYLLLLLLLLLLFNNNNNNNNIVIYKVHKVSSNAESEVPTVARWAALVGYAKSTFWEKMTNSFFTGIVISSNNTYYS